MAKSDGLEELVQPLQAPHVDALADLWVAYWQELMPGVDFAARRDWIVRFLGSPEHATLVIERGGAPAGFATLTGAHLRQLVVAPWAKGRRLARRLLDAAKATSPGSLVLYVDQTNERTMRFYEREGFLIVREGANPVSGRTTWQMRWEKAPEGVAIGDRDLSQTIPTDVAKETKPDWFGDRFVAGLMEHDQVNIARVTDLFRMSSSQLAETVGLSVTSISKADRRAAPKTQTRMREMLEIVGRVRDWAGGEAQAMAWYRSQPIPALDGRTPEALVKAGRASAVREYLDVIALGGFA